MSMSAVEARFQPGSKWLWNGKEVTVVKLSHSRGFVHVDAGAPWPSAVAPDHLEPIVKSGDKVRVLPGAMYNMSASTPDPVQRVGGESVAKNSPDFEGDVLIQGVGYVNVAYLEKVEEEPVEPEPEFKVGDRVRVAEDAKMPCGISSSAAGTTSVIAELEEDGSALLENGGYPALRYLTLVEDEEPSDEPDPLLTAEARVMLDMLEPNERLRLKECGVLTREELRAYYFLSN